MNVYLPHTSQVLNTAVPLLFLYFEPLDQGLAIILTLFVSFFSVLLCPGPDGKVIYEKKENNNKNNNSK
jgi:hypothetical protein